MEELEQSGDTSNINSDEDQDDFDGLKNNMNEEILDSNSNRKNDEINIDFKILKNFTLEKGNGYPISISFDESFSRVLFLTNKSKIILLNLKNFQIINSLEDISSMFWNNLDGHFCKDSLANNSLNEFEENEDLDVFHDYKNRISFGLGHKYNYIISSDLNNNLFFFKDFSSIIKNKCFIFNVHNSLIQNIKVRSDDKIILTFGQSDKMICEWSLTKTNNENLNEKYYPNKNINDLKNDNENIKANFQTENNHLKLNNKIVNKVNDLEKKLFYYKNFYSSNKEVRIFDEYLINELSYCLINEENIPDEEFNINLKLQYSKLIFYF